MSKSCKGLAMELVKCLSETDCVKVSRGSSLSLSLSPLARCAAACFDSIQFGVLGCLYSNTVD
jgi:hypothetical protein